MVSPSISSPPKILPLSYADRAKKAQNIRSPISLQPHRIAVQNVPSVTSEVSTSFLTSPSKPTSNPPNVDYTPDFPAVPTSTVSSHLPTSPTATSAALTNGVKRSSNDLAEKALSIVAAHTTLPQKSPVVNVWNVRKEQMAAARSPVTASSHMSTSQSMPLPPKSGLSPNRSPTSSKSPRESAPNYMPGPSASAATNGAPVVPPPVEYDPFVVRIFTETTRVQIPSLPPSVDTDSWPEVGKLTATPLPNTAVLGQAPDLTLNSRDENQSSNGSASEQLSAGVSRKSEKTKWIPIPAEELQATADALTKAEKRQNQSRKGSQHPQQPRPNTQQSHRSASGSNSTQTQSRLHSASQSASQSRIQSRSESLQSSPRFPRGRKLPGDENSVTGVSGYAAPNRGSAGRSPGTSSPQFQVKHQLPPIQQAPSNTDDSAAPTALPPHFYGQGAPPQTAPYYPTTLHQPSTYLRASPHPPHSGYHSGQSTPPLQPAPYQPVYYIPFPPQPYVYWNGHTRSNPGSGHHSPAYPPPPHMQGGAVIPPHLPQYMHAHLQPPHPHPARRRSETNPVMGTRPPPPHESQPVGGLNVPLVGAGTNGVAGVGERPVVFGSIGVPGASKCPSPAPGVDDEHQVVDEKPFTTFSIGVRPGDAGPSRVRSRTVESMSRSRTATATGSEAGSEARPGGGVELGEEVKVIDLTDPRDSKWEFGTVVAAVGSAEDVVATTKSDDASVGEVRGVTSGYEQLPPVLTSIAGFGSPLQPLQALGHSPIQHPQALGTRSVSGSPPDQLNAQDLGSLPVLLGGSGDDEFEVKDFGYGFGHVSGTGYAETITRAERAERQREHQRELEREKASREALEREALLREEQGSGEPARVVVELEADKASRDADSPSRLRRGGYHGGHERGSSGGFGGRRGRGSNGFGRGYGRQRGGGFQQHPRQAPPFSVTPPSGRFHPLMPMGEPPNGLYPPQHRPPLTTYIPTGYESYPQPLPPLNTAAAPQVTPPVPVPISPISFPLDPTRYYLLGQLEYYLSPQNLAQDFFLRTRMDCRGWVPIALIASFNRIRQLTMDVNLVRDVLVLSSVVQVRGDWVRMNGWEKFVLPDAAASLVEAQEQGAGVQPDSVHEGAVGDVPAEGGAVAVSHAEEGDVEVDGDLEDDDDVVFVMDSEVTGSELTWAPEKRA